MIAKNVKIKFIVNEMHLKYGAPVGIISKILEKFLRENFYYSKIEKMLGENKIYCKGNNHTKEYKLNLYNKLCDKYSNSLENMAHEISAKDLECVYKNIFDKIEGVLHENILFIDKKSLECLENNEFMDIMRVLKSSFENAFFYIRMPCEYAYYSNYKNFRSNLLNYFNTVNYNLEEKRCCSLFFSKNILKNSCFCDIIKEIEKWYFNGKEKILYISKRIDVSCFSVDENVFCEKIKYITI